MYEQVRGARFYLRSW